MVKGPYSPFEVIQSLQMYSSNHTPGYFLLLSLWGNLIENDVAIGRALTISCALLSLSVGFRLARDFVAPVAGLFMIVVLGSNAFFAFYIPHVRMYPLLLLSAGSALWLYLRLIYQLRDARKTDYLALFAAAYLMVNVHVFSITFLAMLGIYHLFVAPKNLRWWQVSAAIAAAVLLFSLYAPVLLTSGIELTIKHWGDDGANGWQAIASWLTVFTNGQPLLLLSISLIGLTAGVLRKTVAYKPYYLLVLAFVLGLGLTAELTDFVHSSGMRHQLPGWYALALFVAAGLYAAYTFRKWCALLLLLWVASGIGFQETANWRDFIAGRARSFTVSPWQLISRLALRSNAPPLIVFYSTPYHYLGPLLEINYSPKERYFDNRGIDLEIVGDPYALDKLSHLESIMRPEMWLVYVEWMDQWLDQRDFEPEIEEVALRYKYEICEMSKVGIDTVIVRVMWRILDCALPDSPAVFQNALIDYSFYVAEPDEDGSKIVFVDEWSARGKVALDNYQMSYQLISSDWANVAQLDLPLVHEGRPRRFSIDIARVPPGDYRLLAIVYDSRTGDRMTWAENEGYIPEMLLLDEIIITSSE